MRSKRYNSPNKWALNVGQANVTQGDLLNQHAQSEIDLHVRIAGHDYTSYGGSFYV